jgi:MFS family permease
MMIDVSLARVYDLVSKQPTSFTRVILFVILAAICIIGQMFLLQFAANKSTQIRRIARLRVKTINNGVRVCQMIVGGLLVFLLLQTVVMQDYHTLALLAILWISYGTSIFLMALLAKRFLSWFSTNRNHIIAMYALASISIAINVGFTISFVTDILIDRPAAIGPYSAGSMVIVPRDSPTALNNSGFFVSSIVAFATLWLSTAMLLSHKAPMLGKLKFWLVIGSPLVLFLAQFASFFGQFLDPLIEADPVTFSIWITLIFTLSKPIGGLLFGAAFYTIAKKFSNDVAIRDYLIVSAIGFVLLFSSNQASVLLAGPYPPFGIATSSFVGIASFFVFLGIYSSAISISQDSALRQLVRKNAVDQSRMLDMIGTAHLTEAIQGKVIKLVQANSEKLMEATGIESSESEENVKRFIGEVVSELNRSKKHSSLDAKDAKIEPEDDT